jgi:hydrogenase maturation protein HypF
MKAARSIHVRGVVQGVGFRPFVFRLARANALAGWVANEETGVAIHLEGEEPGVATFLRDLAAGPPPAARIVAIDVCAAEAAGLADFTIRQTQRHAAPTVRISPDLPVCADCLAELRDPANPRFLYPYINCTNCGPRYTVIERLPYDRAHTTMRAWPMDALCAGQYADPADRRFHAQPIACPECGPHYRLEGDPAQDWPAIVRTAALLRDGAIVAVKGVGGYHLACDARNPQAVRELRSRKYRKEKPFAVMARDLETARQAAELNAEDETLLVSEARPIVLVPKKADLDGVAPDNGELGLMLPYAPLHHLLFDAGAPPLLVMTSANRSSEPIAYRDDEARERLRGIAGAFLVGERPIARRMDDSVVRCGPFGPAILRRSRGYAPGAVAVLPVRRPMLAVGADLKNAITVVVDGQSFVSQHIGDLDDYESRAAFRQTIDDLMSMYEVGSSDLLLACDAHPGYVSTAYARERPASRIQPVQHHRAHIASVLAERQAWETRVVGVSFDGTGYGDDGTIWGGECFVGSVAEGFARVLHLRTAALPGGDAAARYPVQAAAGFLSQIDGLPDLSAPPFRFPPRYANAVELVRKRLRTFDTTSAGRLFDTAAALLGFTREITFEGQAAMWLEHMARGVAARGAYPFPIASGQLDFRPLLMAVIDDRLAGREPPSIARAFQRGLAEGLWSAIARLCEEYGVAAAVLSGGVFQNRLLLDDIADLARSGGIPVWSNAAVPPNDGGISLGQAAIAAFSEDRHA